MRKLRILDFDIENRPLAYLGQDFTTAEITSIAACWHGEPLSMRVWLLGRNKPVTMLAGFRRMYDAADMVTGHYIRKHDLPVINGALLEYDLPPLDAKLTCDTKLDLLDSKYLSLSMENLSTVLGLDGQHKKVHMSNAMWREANRLTPEGLRLTRERVVGDILLHMKLREVLVERDLLTSPKTWRP